jgi:hypothetical protein
VHHPAHRGDASADVGSGGSAVDGEREGQDARGAGLA